MKKFICKATSIILILTIILLTIGCQSKDDNSPIIKTDDKYSIDTLKIEGGKDWGIPNPYLHTSRGPGNAKKNLVYASLLEKDETHDVPWLAKEWSFTGNEYTFTLFDGLTFHDGHKLTTEDVGFSIDYYKKFPPVSSSLGVGEKFIVERYEIVDETTIKIYVKDVNANTLNALGSFVIIPKHIWENVDDPYKYKGEGYLVGSGAYRYGDYDGASGSYEFIAFDGWVNGAPAAERILFVPVSDNVLAFENGEIDITKMPPDLKDKYLNDEKIGYVEKTNDMGYKLLVNFEKCPEFLDKELRQAIYYALDRQSIVDKVFRGMGTVGSAGYVPKDTLFYNPEVTQYPYDEAKAKEIIGARTFSVNLLSSDSSKDLAVAEIIKNNLEAVGFTVNVVAYDSATRDNMINSGEYEFAIVSNGGWGNNPPNYMRTIFSDISKNKGGNPHNMGPIGYENKKLTELCENQVFETDFEKRKQMFMDIEKLVSDEIPLFVIANESSYSVYRKNYFDGWMKTYAYSQAEQNRLSFMKR